MKEKRYDIAVSYASEQRSYVERFVKKLRDLKLSVYYDRDAQASMVGNILDQELHKIYISESNRCILFLSNDYINKPVTKYESQIILSETLYQNGFMYIFKFHDVTLPGLNRNFIYSSVHDFPEPEQYANFMYEVVCNKKPRKSFTDSLYGILADGLEKAMDRCAVRYDMMLQKDQQVNRLLLQLRSDFSVKVQLQVGLVPGRPGVCIWLHGGCCAFDEHAYQGYVEWMPETCIYRLENRGILLDLTPEVQFQSTDTLIQRLEANIQKLLGG